MARLNCAEWFGDERDVDGRSLAVTALDPGEHRDIDEGRRRGWELGLSRTRVGCAGRERELHKSPASLPRNHSLLRPSPPCSPGPSSAPSSPKMTFCYQRQCEDSCYSPCSYGTAVSSRSCDWGSPCGYQGYYGRLCGYRDYCPTYSPRYCSPYSSRYFQRYSYGSCYPCYQC